LVDLRQREVDEEADRETDEPSVIVEDAQRRNSQADERDRSSGGQRGDGEAAGVAKTIQHVATGRKRAHTLSVVALIEVEAGLLAVHDIDLIRWFTDSEIVEIHAQTSSAVAEREDIALLQFRTASGVLAHINTNWLTPFKARNVTVATRGKYVMGDLLTRQVTECFGFKPDGSYSMRHLPVGHDEPLRAELIAFLHAVRTGGVPAVTGEEAVASLEIAIRCLDGRSAQSAAPQRKGPRRVVG